MRMKFNVFGDFIYQSKFWYYIFTKKNIKIFWADYKLLYDAPASD